MSNRRQQLVQEVMESISALQGSFHRGYGPMFKKHGFGWPHLKLMLSMAASDDGVSVNELSKHLDITPAAVTQFVDKLVAKGLVERLSDPKDRRVVRIRLTPGAQKKFSVIKQFYFDRTASLFKNLSDDELEQLSGILQKIDSGADFDKHEFHKRWRETKKGKK